MTDYIFQLARGTSAQWAASSRVLRAGEPGVDTDLDITKHGDGVNLWPALPVTGRTEFNVRDFGAKGDGTTNDYAAIQAAINAAVGTSGTFGAVLFPGGTYKINTGLLVSGKVRLIGRDRATIIDGSGIPADAAVIQVLGASQIVGFVMDGFDIIGHSGADGIRLGDTSGSIALTDFEIAHVRIRSCRDGIVGRYAWCGLLNVVRIHDCNRPMFLGPQVNAITFNSCSYSTFHAPTRFSNCEGLQFNSQNVVNADAAVPAFDFFQSQAVFVNPYFETVDVLASIGSSGEATPSSFVTIGGRVTGLIRLQGTGGLIDIHDPNIAARGVGADPTLRLQIDNAGVIPNRATRRLAVGLDQAGAAGVKVVQRWKGATAWPFNDAFGGGGVSNVAGAGFYTVTSTSAAQGFRINSTLTIGTQYVFSYRMRKADSAVTIKLGAGSSGAIPVVTDATADFETFHIPFVATDTVLRVLFNAAVDVQYVSLVEGLRVLDWAS